MKRVGIIGYGAIARSIIADLRAHPVRKHELAAVLTRPSKEEEARAALPGTTLVTRNLHSFLDAGLDIVIEAAGQQAVRDLAVSVLERSRELQILSAGALADAQLRSDVEEAAESHCARVTIPAGAMAGFRGLLALRHAGLKSVTYTSTKPPAAWRGTPAENTFALDRIDAAVELFSGNARQAALQFPKNANLAAVVALAGLGFEHTRVRLIADPTTEYNSGHINARSDVGDLDVTLSGPASGGNLKTSEVTAWSVIAALHNSVETLAFA